MLVESHGCDRSLVACDDRLHSLLREGPHLDMALLCVRNGESAAALTVESAKPVRIVASVQTVDQSQVREVVNVGLHCEDNDNSTAKTISS